MITSAAEAPGLLAIAFLVDGRGRKWSLRAGLLLTGLSILLLLAAGPGGGAQLFMLFLSRAGIMGAYSVLYIYTPEIYPTKVGGVSGGECGVRMDPWSASTTGESRDPQ